MSDNDTHGDSKRTGVSRRRFVAAAGATGATAAIAGCGGGDGGDGGSDGSDGSDGGDGGSTGDGGSGDGTTTVKWAADSRSKSNAEGFKQALSDAGLSDNIELEVLGGSQVTDNRRSKYQQWLSGGRTEPTMLMMDSGWTIPFIAREQLLNMSQSDVVPDSVVSNVKDNYFQASVNTAQGQNGDLFGVPLFPDFPTMQYRKDLLREAGYSDSDFSTWASESMSWKKFSNITKEVMETDGVDVDYGYTFQANVYEGLSCCDFNEFMTSWGGAYFGNPEENLFGPIGDRPITVDEEQVLDSIRMVRTFIHGQSDPESLSGYAGQIAPQAVLQWTEEPSRKPFTGGNAIMHRNWPYSININGTEENFGEDLGVMPIPYGVTADEAEYPMTGGPVAALGGWHMTINPNAPTAKQEAAAKIIETMQTEQFRIWAFSSDGPGWIPPTPSLLGSSSLADKAPVMGRYLEQLKVAGENAIPRPVTAIWPQQSGKISKQVNTAYAQGKTPQKAMSDLKSTLQSIEQQY